jgi:signal transduction histidine kinase
MSFSPTSIGAVCPPGRARTSVSTADNRAIQRSLHRLARLVARGVRPERVFVAITQEALRYCDAGSARLIRYEPDGTATLLASTLLCRDKSSCSAVAVPIHVHGRRWGMMVVGSADADLAPDTEQRLSDFTERIAIAIANVQVRAELLASRARIVTAADETRRRIERDLHDGAQQRLVGLALRLRMTSSRVSIDDPVRSDIDALADEVLGIIAELREISSGIHPTVLSRSGLGAAMRMLARRSAVPVYTDIRLTGRLPDAVETCAYYSVSELLTNAAKHAHATLAKVVAAVDGHTLRIYVSDDGIGGVNPRRGSGLTGIKDRVEALGGIVHISSDPAAGTKIRLELPTPTGRLGS